MVYSQGNIEFESSSNNNEEAVVGQTKKELTAAAALLKVELRSLEVALCSRVLAARGEILNKTHTLSQALYARDAFSKVPKRFI